MDRGYGSNALAVDFSTTSDLLPQALNKPPKRRIVGILGASSNAKTVANHLCGFHDFVRLGIDAPAYIATSVICGIACDGISIDTDPDAVDPFWGNSQQTLVDRIKVAIESTMGGDVWLRSLERKMGNRGGNWAILNLTSFADIHAIKHWGGKIVAFGDDSPDIDVDYRFRKLMTPGDLCDDVDRMMWKLFGGGSEGNGDK